MLDAATGPSEAYGAFAINSHTDDVASESSDATVAAAQAHGVPVMSAERLLNFGG